MSTVLVTNNITRMTHPFTVMLDSILAFIPKLLAASLILAIGWFAATIVRRIVSNLLDALQADKVIEKLRLERVFEGTTFGNFVGNTVFVVILIPVTIAALEQDRKSVV